MAIYWNLSSCLPGCSNQWRDANIVVSLGVPRILGGHTDFRVSKRDQHAEKLPNQVVPGYYCWSFGMMEPQRSPLPG